MLCCAVLCCAVLDGGSISVDIDELKVVLSDAEIAELKLPARTFAVVNIDADHVDDLVVQDVEKPKELSEKYKAFLV